MGELSWVQVGPKRAAGVGKKEEGGGVNLHKGTGPGRTRNFVFVEWVTWRTCPCNNNT